MDFEHNPRPFANPYCRGIVGVARSGGMPERIQWVKPVFVCEVVFAEWTLDGDLRQTTFLGWRDDKTPTEIVVE